MTSQSGSGLLMASWPHLAAGGILVSRPERRRGQWEHRVLTPGPPGSSLRFCHFYKLLPHWINLASHGILSAWFNRDLGGSWASLVAWLVKNLPAMQETLVWFLVLEDPLEKRTATHSSIMAWKIPWTVWSMGSRRVGPAWAAFK